jgi:hypothetical protein
MFGTGFCQRGPFQSLQASPNVGSLPWPATLPWPWPQGKVSWGGRSSTARLSYAIGAAEPVSVHVETFDAGTVEADAMEKLVRDNFKLTPRDIIESLDLRRPIYRKTAAYGHFGPHQR